MTSARFPDSICCPFVCAFVRLSRVRGFRLLYLFVSVYVCNIPPFCIGIVRLHIRTRIYIYVRILCSCTFAVSEAMSHYDQCMRALACLLLVLFHLQGIRVILDSDSDSDLYSDSDSDSGFEWYVNHGLAWYKPGH